MRWLVNHPAPMERTNAQTVAKPIDTPKKIRYSRESVFGVLDEYIAP